MRRALRSNICRGYPFPIARFAKICRRGKEMAHVGWYNGIIGAGAMGRSAAQIAASAGLDVILIDIDGSALDQGITAIERNLDRLVTDRLISATDRVSALSRITRATACDPLANADVGDRGSDR